jgi:uncharacterized protein
MTPHHNKAIMEGICAELAKGNGTPFREAMADDFTWSIIGNTAERILADGEHVVIQCRGRVTTVSGKPYNNTYCWVIRMADGKMKELTEYCDTALINDTWRRHPDGSSTRHRLARGKDRAQRPHHLLVTNGRARCPA